VPERFLGRSLGKYRVDGLAGSGGFAWVYRAHDPELEIDVALKVLKPQFAGDPQIEERFRREASTAAKLRHPNIVAIHAVGREGDAVYFAMDYLPDGLAQRLETVALLPEEFVIQVGIDVAGALGFAHRQGVIHRDIKVDNILFDAHGNAVVADFGIARALAGSPGHTGTNMVVGTPQYFAPEQARAKPLDGRADLYSLGVTLFRAATGTLPFNGDDWYEIARQHVEEPPPDPRSINPALSEGFADVILHCLQKRPEDRPASGEALRSELAALLGVTAEHSTLRTRITGEEPTLVVDALAASVPERRRRRVPPALVAGGIVLAVAAAAIPAFVRRGDGANGAVNVPPTGTTALADSADSASSLVPTPGPVTVPHPDSVVSTVSIDSSALRAHVALAGPANATLSVNGVAVGTGAWRADTLRPGTYEFTAALPDAPEGCASARARTTRTLRPGRAVQSIALAPRPCGLVTFEADPATARYALIPTAADGARFDGVLPLPAPLLVPAGVYRLTVADRYCSQFTNDSLVVAPERTTRQPKIRLICQRP
jgi:serine/threonine-protein kinase